MKTYISQIMNLCCSAASLCRYYYTPRTRPALQSAFFYYTPCAGLHLISVMLCGENKSPNSTNSFYYEKDYTFLNLVPCVERWLLQNFHTPDIEMFLAAFR